MGFVGVPYGGPQLQLFDLFTTNVGVRGGAGTVRDHIEELLPEVLSGALAPGRVFDVETPLARAPEACAAMDQRRAVKVLLRP